MTNRNPLELNMKCRSFFGFDYIALKSVDLSYTVKACESSQYHLTVLK